jgi:hypothetical protein
MTNTYEQRQEARRQRYLARAEKAEASSQSAYDSAKSIASYPSSVTFREGNL